MTPNALKTLYRANLNTITRWSRELGVAVCVGRVPAGPPPADFVEVAARLTRNALEIHYGRSGNTIGRWIAMSGAVAARRPSGRAVGRPVPTDFAEHVARMNIDELRRHYGAYGLTVQKWLAATGLQPRPLPDRRRARFLQRQPAVPAVNATDAAQAAQFLRSRTIVYPCDILTAAERAKLPNRGKGLWYVNGRGAIPASDLIALAEAKGFDRRAWCRI